MANAERPMIEHLGIREAEELTKLYRRIRLIEDNRVQHPDNQIYKDCLRDAGGDVEVAKTLFAIRTAPRI